MNPNLNDDLILLPIFGERYYKRLLAANLSDCPEVAPFVRLPRPETRYGWPREPQTPQKRRVFIPLWWLRCWLKKARQEAAAVHRGLFHKPPKELAAEVVTMIVFGGGLGWLFMSQLFS